MEFSRILLFGKLFNELPWNEEMEECIPRCTWGHFSCIARQCSNLGTKYCPPPLHFNQIHRGCEDELTLDFYRQVYLR